jgi:glycosyltransferase involved in cell wall biosynthesis
VAPSPEIVGGQSIQAKRLVAALRHAGTPIEWQPTNAPIPRALAPLRKIRYLRTIVTESAYVEQLTRQAHHADLIHVFVAAYSSFFLTLIPALVAAKLARKPLILHHHDGRAGGHFAQSPRARSLAAKADRIVVPSGYLVDALASVHLPATAIPNTVDTLTFQFRVRTAPRPYFLHNRGLEAHYNPQCSLRAFAMVQGHYPDARLDIAHDGPERESLERMATALNLRNVRFLGAVDSDQMRRLYNVADIYLMSPNIDNMPLSVLECFASGLPVVSTAAGGVPYLVDHERTGLLAAINDHESLAAAALRLLREPGLASGLAGNAFAECAKYQTDAVAGQWLSLYREVTA